MIILVSSLRTLSGLDPKYFLPFFFSENLKSFTFKSVLSSFFLMIVKENSLLPVKE